MFKTDIQNSSAEAERNRGQFGLMSFSRIDTDRTLIFCFVYSGLVTFAGFIGYEYFGSSTVYILFVAIVSFLVARYFARNTEFFGKKGVDAFYYSVGLFGVVLLFSGQTVQRIEVEEYPALSELKLEHDKALTDRQDLDLTHAAKKATFEFFIENEEEIFKGINSALVEVLLMSPEYGFEACGAAYLYRRGIIEPGKFPTKREYSTIHGAEKFCMDARLQLRSEIKEYKREDLSTALLSNQERIGIDYWFGEFSKDGNSYRLSDLIHAIEYFRDTTVYERKKDEIEARIQDTQSKISTLENSIAQRIQKAKMLSSTITNLLLYHFWPYVLIVLLSLKLARYD